MKFVIVFLAVAVLAFLAYKGIKKIMDMPNDPPTRNP